MDLQASLNYYLSMILLEKEVKSHMLRMRKLNTVLEHITCYGRMLPGVHGLLICVTSSHDEIYFKALSLSKGPEKFIIIMIMTPTFSFYYNI